MERSVGRSCPRRLDQSFWYGRGLKFGVGKLIKLAGKLNLGAQIQLTKPKAEKLPAVVHLAKHTKESLV